jgi:hypothetical protein
MLLEGKGHFSSVSKFPIHPFKHPIDLWNELRIGKDVRDCYQEVKSMPKAY